MSELMDLPPDQAAKLKRKMNIDPDYFVAVVEDPTPARRKDLKRDLRLLLDEMKIRPTR
jgi:hypothetical protein